MNIYVSNINFRTRNGQLQELFEGFGEVSSANIITDRETDRSRGFGFVEMPNDEEARKAIESLDGTEFDGKKIVVNEARPKAERPERGGFNRGGGFGRGNGGYDRGNGGGFNRNRY